jgi:hypothetical protein
MLVNTGYRQKESSLNLVGADHPEFTPLERVRSLAEGGSPQVGGSHLTPPEIQGLGVKLTSGRRSWERPFVVLGNNRNPKSGRRSSGDRAFVLLVGGGQEETTGEKS